MKRKLYTCCFTSKSHSVRDIIECSHLASNKKRFDVFQLPCSYLYGVYATQYKYWLSEIIIWWMIFATHYNCIITRDNFIYAAPVQVHHIQNRITFNTAIWRIIITNTSRVERIRRLPCLLCPFLNNAVLSIMLALGTTSFSTVARRGSIIREFTLEFAHQTSNLRPLLLAWSFSHTFQLSVSISRMQVIRLTVGTNLWDPSSIDIQSNKNST